MSKDTKKKKSCRPLDEHQSEQLARMIIASTKREVRYGVTRVERVTAPTGAVILSKDTYSPHSTTDYYEGELLWKQL